MKKHLNTLFVTSQGAYLSKEGETVLVSIEKQKRLQLPIHTLDGIICFGRVMCSPYLMGFCAEKDVAVSFLSENGRFLARVQGPVSGNVLLRREHYRKADDSGFSARTAGAILVGKIANSRTVLQRALRDHGDKMDKNDANVGHAVMTLADSLKRLESCDSLDVLRGIEGEAARTYFGVFDHLITNTRELSYSTAATGVRRWTMSIACFRLFTRCCFTMCVQLSRALVWIPQSGFFTGTVRAAPAWHSISWRSSGLFLRIGWSYRL